MVYVYLQRGPQPAKTVSGGGDMDRVGISTGNRCDKYVENEYDDDGDDDVEGKEEEDVLSGVM